MTKTASTAQLRADATTVASLLAVAGYPPISKWRVRWHKFVQFQRQKMHPAYRLTCGWRPAIGIIALPTTFVRACRGKAFEICWPEFWYTRDISLSGSYEDDTHTLKDAPSFVGDLMQRVRSLLPDAIFEITLLGDDPIITCRAQGEKHYVLIYDDNGPLTPT